jgi:hypothetical protein
MGCVAANTAFSPASPHSRVACPVCSKIPSPLTETPEMYCTLYKKYYIFISFLDVNYRGVLKSKQKFLVAHVGHAAFECAVADDGCV